MLLTIVNYHYFKLNLNTKQKQFNRHNTVRKKHLGLSQMVFGNL